VEVTAPGSTRAAAAGVRVHSLTPDRVVAAIDAYAVRRRSMGGSMGMWDLRCMVTGLPLTPNDPATAVLLTRTGDGYRPAALGLRGSYNCYGTVDSVVEDVNAGLVWAYALERLADGRLAVGAGESLEPADTVEHLLEAVERNQLSFASEDLEAVEPAVTLDGETIYHALVYQPVWDGLSASAALDQGPVDGLFGRLFGRSGMAFEIYHGRLAEVSGPIRQLGVVDDFLAARGQGWAPPGEERQRYPVDLGARFSVSELRDFVAEARRDFSDVEVLRTAIDQADRGVRPG
jgi:hypothetical protein